MRHFHPNIDQFPVAFSARHVSIQRVSYPADPRAWIVHQIGVLTEPALNGELQLLIWDLSFLFIANQDITSGDNHAGMKNARALFPVQLMLLLCDVSFIYLAHVKWVKIYLQSKLFVIQVCFCLIHRFISGRGFTNVRPSSIRDVHVSTGLVPFYFKTLAAA